MDKISFSIVCPVCARNVEMTDSIDKKCPYCDNEFVGRRELFDIWNIFTNIPILPSAITV